MKFGLAFANIEPFAGPARAVQLAHVAERVGFESLWAVDHVVIPKDYRSRYPYDPSGRIPSGEDMAFPDPLIWLAYVAQATSTLRLGTAILIVPERNPVVLAKELATLDYLSGGRVILGAGVGWLKEEYEAVGVPFEGRGRRVEEAIQAMRALWSAEVATYSGTTVSFHQCYLRPQPPGGTIPVHIGGHSLTAARRAGRMGDGFFPFGVGRGDVPARLEVVRRSAEEAGRDPGLIEVTMDSFFTDEEAALADVKALEGLGATRVLLPASMFGPDPEEGLCRYADEVIARI
jgi:probable F420-dependent oxidoreductase